MNIIPWRTKHDVPVTRETPSIAPIAEFRSEIDRLFERYFRGSWMEPLDWSEPWARTTGELVPAVDVAEDDAEITVRAEVPGLTPEDIDIRVSGNVLTIRGEKKETKEERTGDRYHYERRFGSFSRSVELPASADLEKIDAEERNGVLTVHVRKMPASQAKKISVKGTPAKKLAGAGT
jgi:HSP20 family protein